MKLSKALNRYRVEDGKHFRLKDHDPADTGKMKPGPHASEVLTKGVARLAALPGKLYAPDRWKRRWSGSGTTQARLRLWQ